MIPPKAATPSANVNYVHAATDSYPRNAREVELCDDASSVDFLYLGALLLADAGSIFLDTQVLKLSTTPSVRMLGPALVGLSWGATLGGGYLALPKCHPHWVSYPPPEGNVRLTWPAAVSIALVAGATAPFIVAIETGPQPIEWPVQERSLRLIVAGVSGAIGALVPYVLPPKTWRAAKELERLRVESDGRGAFLTYGVRF